MSTNALFVIGGFNGLSAVQAWVSQLLRHHDNHDARAYSWRHAQAAARDIAALPGGTPVTLIGHSLGGGQAQRLVQSLPTGAVTTLITVAPFAPAAIDPELTRQKLGHWLNILSSPQRRDWRDTARKLAAPLLGWREQGEIAQACENHRSPHPHQDFYQLMSERCGPVEHGQYRPLGA